MGGLSGTVCMLLGGWLVMQGIMSAGMIYSALNYFSAISNGFSNMTNYIVEMRSTKGTIEKLGKQRDMPIGGLALLPHVGERLGDQEGQRGHGQSCGQHEGVQYPQQDG